MAYNDAIPQPTDSGATSQPQILANFSELKTYLEINHEDFNAGNQGKHIYVTLVKQAVAPTTAANEVALYSKDNAAGDPALYYRPESDGTEVEVTASKKAETGCAILPSGIIIKWGKGTVDADSAGTATYDTTITMTTAYSAQITLDGAAGMALPFYVTSFDEDDINVLNTNTAGGTRNFYYQVIGV